MECNSNLRELIILNKIINKKYYIFITLESLRSL